MQISVVDGPSPTLTNAGDATLNGGELELSWKVSRAFTLAAYSSYLDAEYDSLTQRALNSGVTLNSRLPNVSKWQFGASADGTFPLGGGLELRPHADWNYRSSLYVDSANTDRKNVGEGKGGSVSVDRGGGRILKKKKKK